MSWTTALLALAVWGTVALAPYFFAARTVVVDVVDTAPTFFQPDVLRVRAGDTVVFSLGHDHGTGAAHTATSIAGPQQFDSGVVHWDYKWTPTQAGEYTYICAIHPYMKGIIAVDQDPSVAHAVTGEGGVWPPKTILRAGLPDVPGQGQVWIDLQWVPKPDRPNEPGAVAVVPDGRAYVSVNAQNFLAEIDPTSHEVVGRVEFAGRGPHGLWADRSGRTLVAALMLSSQAAIVAPRPIGSWPS